MEKLKSLAKLITLALCIFSPLIITMCYQHSQRYVSNYTLSIHTLILNLVAILLSYATLTKYITKYLNTFEQKQLYIIPPIFMVGCMFYIMIFGNIWNSYGPLATAQMSYGILNKIYLSSTIFTTTGFGDISPSSPESKLLAIFEQIFGVTFISTYICIIISKLRQN
ncbi:potassium channel family protein [Aquitalea sp. LB_tupeE]|uniref:potassium channel family protein n=1 Tax=Aquitalea sp. LB_tupeE TaxID=2748078 RepID=UPI0015BCBF59|nr:two pore domain potassium channel family protein [Aquitalea sp. LB_tupeE]